MNALEWMLRPGEFCREWRRQGAVAQFVRFVVRPLILQTLPCPCPPTAPFEVHLQICRRDWLNALWTLKTLRYFSEREFRLVLHRDKSIRFRQLDTLRAHFPGVIIPDHAAMLEACKRQLGATAPTLCKLRHSGRFFTLPKVIDAWLSARSETIYSIDPDVLFFSRPDQMLDESESAHAFCQFNVERFAGFPERRYCFHVDAIREACDLEMLHDFSCGLGWFQRSKLDWGLVESVFSRLPVNEEDIFMTDQTVLGIVAARHGRVKLAPLAYAVEPVDSLEGVVARHYYGKTRHLMFREGMLTLWRRGFLERYDAFMRSQSGVR